MTRTVVLAVRIVLAAALLGALGIQVVMLPLLAADLADLTAQYAHLRVPLLALAALGIATVQVVCVCVWRLVTMARRGTVFSAASFRHVDVIIGAVTVAALLLFSLGVLLAPGEAVAPGVVLLIGGAAVLVAGVALVVVVLRALLAQAVARDAEARTLQAELDEVI